VYVPRVEVLEGRLAFSGLTALPGAFNRAGIYTDAYFFNPHGGLDGDGYALSATLLGPAITWNGNRLDLGPPNTNNVVSTAGQTLPLPAGTDTALSFLAVAVNATGSGELNQTFTVTYTDGATQVLTQSLSDWFTPQGYAGESIVAVMPYRNDYFGGRDARTFYVYGYRFALDNPRTVRSITLPTNSNVEVLAMDLTPTVAVSDGGGIFNGTPFAAAGTVNGGSSLDGVGLMFSYYTGESASGTPLSEPPSSAGTYTVVASFPGGGAYAPSSAAATFTITQATPTIRVADPGGVYNGSAHPVTDATVLGVGGLPVASNGDLALTYSYYQGASLLPSAPVHPGNYTVVAHYAGSHDYTATDSSPLLFSITPAPLTVTAEDATKLYGAALPAFSASYSGFVSGDGPGALGGSLSFTTPATSASHVAGGPYPVTPSGLTSSDYAITFQGGNLAVTPAPLTVTAEDATKLYGAALPAFGARYSGFVNGDGPAALGGSLAFETPATAASHVVGGPYPVAPSGLTSNDYTLTFVSGHLTVIPAPLTVTAEDTTKVYGAALPSFTVRYSGFVNDDGPGALGGTLAFGTPATTGSHVAGGPYPVTPSGLASTDYAITYASGQLAVSPASLTVTAEDATKLYGAALPSFAARYSGFVNGDGPGALGGTLVLETPATAASHVAGGPYPIMPSGLTSTDYAITYTSGQLAVAPAPLAITAVDATKVYGAALPPVSVLDSGFVNGDGPGALSGTLTFTTPATAASHVVGGPYPVTPVGRTSSDYAITFLSGRLAVTPAPLTIAAVDATKVYGAALPSFAARYRGFVSGDGPGALGGALSFATPATAASHVAGGPYPVTPSGLSSSDYTITFLGGHLSVRPAPLTITADDKIQVDGQPASAFTASFSGFANGDGPGALGGTLIFNTTKVSAGSSAIVPSGLTSSDYAITFVSGRLSVRPAPSRVDLLPAGSQTNPPAPSPAAGPAVSPPALAGLFTTATFPLINSGGGTDALPEVNEPAMPTGTFPALPNRPLAAPLYVAATEEEHADAQEEQEEWNRLFGMFGVSQVYQEKDLFGELIEASAPVEDPVSERSETAEEGGEAAAVAGTWLVLTTVACETSVAVSMRR
jgi:hypothetical protein